MHNSTYSTCRPQQAWRAFPSPSTSLPQRSETQLLVSGSFSSSVYPEPRRAHSAFLKTSPTSSPVPQHNTEATHQCATNGPDPVQYSLEDGPRDLPGTAAYYKSWAFRIKDNEGTTLVPEQEDEAGEDLDDSADEDYIKRPKKAEKMKSLVVIFSRTNVRRASMQRKVNERMQRSNRRMKFMRKLENTKPLSNWD